jgi:hypothetical protein
VLSFTTSFYVKRFGSGSSLSTSGTNVLNLFYFFWRARVCRPLLRLSRPFMIFEGCLDSNTECCRSKLARYRLGHPSLYLATHPSQFVYLLQIILVTRKRINPKTRLNKTVIDLRFSKACLRKYGLCRMKTVTIRQFLNVFY